MIKNTQAQFGSWFCSLCMAAVDSSRGPERNKTLQELQKRRARNAVAGEITCGGGVLQILFSEYLLYQIAANLLQLKRSPLV